jgi:hypothetical protein
MEQANSILNEFEEKEKFGTLKTLTVLTFIGCGIIFILSVWGFAMGKSGYEKMQQAIADGTVDKMPAFFRDSYSPEKMEVMRKTVENGLPIFIINVICLGLCVFGAIQMRKRKAEGYWMWLIGELLPYLCLLFFVGAGALTGFSNYIGFAIVATFILLYTFQRKHLTK